MTGRVCAVEVCDRPVKESGLCGAHYRRHRDGRRMDTPIKVPAGERTHCPQGHEYTEANTARGRGRAGRSCRTCQAARNAARNAVRAAARAARPATPPTPAPVKAKPSKSKLPKGWDQPKPVKAAKNGPQTVDKNTQWVDPGPPLTPELVAAAQALLARHGAQDLAPMLGLDEGVAA